jgi:hypothetical protein
MNNQPTTRFSLAAKPQQGDQWGYAKLTQAGAEGLVRLLKPLYSSDDPAIRDMAIGVVDMLDQAGPDTKNI